MANQHDFSPTVPAEPIADEARAVGVGNTVREAGMAGKPVEAEADPIV